MGHTSAEVGLICGLILESDCPVCEQMPRLKAIQAFVQQSASEEQKCNQLRVTCATHMNNMSLWVCMRLNRTAPPREKRLLLAFQRNQITNVMKNKCYITNILDSFIVSLFSVRHISIDILTH